MTVTLSLFAGAGAQFFDNNGNPLTGGKIYTYGAGTTTPLATYTTNSNASFHTNPIVLDSAGRVPSGGEIWLQLGLGYKFVIRTAADVLIATYDNIPSSAQPPAANDADSIMYEQGYTVTAGSFVVGKIYKIVSVGTTDFTLIGATANSVGLHFIATGVGSGTGTAELSQTVETKLQQTVSVKDFGAVGDGVTDDTSAIQAAIQAAKNLYFPPGTYLVDTVAINNKGYLLTGSGTITTIIKAKATSTKLLQILGISTWATENVVKNMTLDISLMSDVSTNVALYHGYSWGCLFENIIVTGNGTNKLSYFADRPGAGNGVYTSTFTNVNFESTTGKVKLLGVSTGDAITTLMFNNCAFGQFDANNVMDITLMMPVVQGNLNKFLLANTLGFSVIGGDIEGTSGTCYVFGAFVNHLMSLNNELASFSGTYTSGTVASCIMQDFGKPFLLKKNDQGMTFNDIPITFTNDTVDFTDAPVTYTKTGASFFRTQFNASNASAQQVDLQLTSAVGSAYIGQTSTGKAFFDSRGSGGVALQVGGTDKVGVDTTDRLIASTASKTTVGAAGGASALPATPSGYLRIMRGATEFVIPYYAA